MTEEQALAAKEIREIADKHNQEKEKENNNG